jgi:hypothetical protein
VVTSLDGAMFAPRPDRIAAELTRVCRPGGTIAMGNWTREGFVGTMFTIFARFIAPPGMPAPVLWGDEEIVRERFGSRVSHLRLTRVSHRFDYPFGPGDVVELFRQNHGPTARAFATLGDADHRRFVPIWSGCGAPATLPARRTGPWSTRSTWRSSAFEPEASTVS